MPTSVINEILSFCPQGTIASGDIMALEDYKNDVQRLRGHQPGIARRELENMALRQSSFVAAGTLAANRTYGFVYTGAQYELVGDVDTNTTYPLATASNDGLMAKGDKGKLDGIAVGAEVNQNAFGNILVGSTTIAADTKTDTLTFVAGTNVTLTPDAANDKLTIAANLGKWRPNAANPTGLYVPKLSDQFFPSLGGWRWPGGGEFTNRYRP